MVISVSNSYLHKTACEKPSYDSKQVEQLVMQSIEKLGLTQEDVCWNQQGHLEIKKPDNLKLHTLMLKMEECGLDMKMTKQTIIEIN